MMNRLIYIPLTIVLVLSFFIAGILWLFSGMDYFILKFLLVYAVSLSFYLSFDIPEYKKAKRFYKVFWCMYDNPDNKVNHSYTDITVYNNKAVCIGRIVRSEYDIQIELYNEEKKERFTEELSMELSIKDEKKIYSLTVKELRMKRDEEKKNRKEAFEELMCK